MVVYLKGGDVDGCRSSIPLPIDRYTVQLMIDT